MKVAEKIIVGIFELMLWLFLGVVAVLVGVFMAYVALVVVVLMVVLAPIVLLRRKKKEEDPVRDVVTVVRLGQQRRGR